METAISRHLAPAVIEAGTPAPDQMREKIFALETHILALPQTECQTVHHHAPGIYMRELRIPKDTVLTGAIHKTEHLNILSQGEITVWTDEGMKRVKAPAVIKSGPGIKRAGYTHEDTVWITVCHNPTGEQDEGKLWDLFVTNDPKAFELAQAEQKTLPQGGE